MKVVENNEWKQQVTCSACTSVLDLEFNDLFAYPHDKTIMWACCICKFVNEIDTKHLPEGRDVPYRNKHSPPSSTPFTHNYRCPPPFAPF